MTVMKLKPGIKNDFVPKFLLLTKNALKQFKTEQFYENHPWKPSIAIFLDDIEKAVEFKYPSEYLKKDTNYDHMFEIIVKENKIIRSKISYNSQRSDKFVKRFRSSSESFYSRAAIGQRGKTTAQSQIMDEFESAKSSQGSRSKAAPKPFGSLKKWQKDTFKSRN